jgi:hypothetical protein
MITLTHTLSAVALGSLLLAGCAMEVGDDDEGDAELTETEAAGSQVCVYSDASYGGKVACWGGLTEGKHVTIADLLDSPVGNDQISSFKVKKGLKVRFYRDVDGEGPDYRANGFFGNVNDPDLGGGNRPVGNDSISSIYIERQWDTANSYDDPQVCLYSDDNYLGDYACFGGVHSGQRAYVPALFHTAVGNDRASSIAVASGIKVRLYSAVNYSGSMISVGSGHRSLGSAGLGNDVLSSLVIERE